MDCTLVQWNHTVGAVPVSRHTLEWKHNVQMLRWVESPKRPKAHIMITSTDRPLATAQQTPDNITNAPAYLFRAARMCSHTNLGTPDTVRWRRPALHQDCCGKFVLNSRAKDRHLLPLRTLRLVYHSVSMVPVERKIAVEICDGWFEASGWGLSMSGKKNRTVSIRPLLLILTPSHWKKRLSSGHVFVINLGIPHTSGILTGFASLRYYPDSSWSISLVRNFMLYQKSKLEPVSECLVDFSLFGLLWSMAPNMIIFIFMAIIKTTVMHLRWKYCW